ncbi:MAG: hypothetical protein AAFR73_06395 [Pseudomonadota bacterium]
MSALRHGLFFCFILLIGCGAADPRWATDAEIARFAYAPAAPPEIRLYTIVSTRNGSGVHSALLITTAHERILFDPAGSFALPSVPERNDVLYGMSPEALKTYIDYHARQTFDVFEQRLDVPAAQAEQIAESAKSYGAVPQAHCAVSVSRILRQTTGLEQMRVSYFPNVIRRQFGAIEGVRTRFYSDNDANANAQVLTEASGRAAQP